MPSTAGVSVGLEVVSDNRVGSSGLTTLAVAFLAFCGAAVNTGPTDSPAMNCREGMIPVIARKDSFSGFR